LLLTLFVSWNQWSITKRQVKDLDLSYTDFIPIKISSETIFGIQAGYIFSARAALYVCDLFILIIPKAGDWCTGIYRESMPILFTRDLALMKSFTTVNNVYVPKSILEGMDQSVEIVFKRNPASRSETTMYIDFCNAGDFDKLRAHFFTS
jgi:hypothetical protein